MRGRFDVLTSVMSMSLPSLLGVCRQYGDVGETEDREFGEDGSWSAGSDLTFTSCC